jgi:hypothetical protein
MEDPYISFGIEIILDITLTFILLRGYNNYCLNWLGLFSILVI